MSEELQIALVTGAFSRKMRLRLQDGSEVTGRMKGKKLQPVCGDLTSVQPIPNEPEWLITGIEPRRNQLTRPDSRGRTEVLAANIDVVVVMAAVEPDADWFVVDRYVAAAEIMGAESVIVFNKTDLGALSDDASEALEDYRSSGYRVIETSAETGSAIDDLVAAITGSIAIVVGQSGVGKSSVVNRIVADANLRTGDISASSGEGRHTTVSSVMLELPGGGGVIDSPGVRDYAPVIDDTEGVTTGFREIASTGNDCRFANCRHLREPDCAVKDAVEAGTISARRYESYKRLVSLVRELADRRR